MHLCVHFDFIMIIVIIL